MSATVLPMLREQRLAALVEANRVRSQRAELKRDLKAGRRDLAATLANPPAYVLSMEVFDLLLTGRSMGPVKVRKMLAKIPVSPTRQIGSLSARETREIVAALHG